MGYAIAEAEAGRGHEVVLVSGPCGLGAPEAVERIEVVTAEEMYRAVETRIPAVEAAVMVAAVADYRPVTEAGEKIKKTGDHLVVEMEKTRDILGSARGAMGFSGTLVGFAAETENLEANAREKLEQKGCDLLVANDVSGSEVGFDSDQNEILILFADGRLERPERATKRALAELLVKRIEEIHK
jgi:phosphopantothenoylcysteine synthetase/decarboxylase